MAGLCFLDPGLIDGYLQVSGPEATATTRALAGELRGGTVVVLLNDSGLKYLSTDLWT